MKIDRLIFFLVLISGYPLVVLQAINFSVQPNAQEISLDPQQQRIVVFQLHNCSRNTQHITLQLEDCPGLRPGIITNLSWQDWCMPDKWSYQLVPGEEQDIFLTVHVPDKIQKEKNKKLLVMCFFSERRTGQAEDKNSPFIIPRIGAALYVCLK